MRTLDLCGICAAKLGEVYTVRKIASGINKKITCAECGRRRYGATYEVRKKEDSKK